MSDDVHDNHDNNNNDKPKQVANKNNVRHLEKRRTSTCAFADRIAHASLEIYRSKVVAVAVNNDDDSTPNEYFSPTCIAAILIHDANTDELSVVALGVGTKFLTQAVLQQDKQQQQYGRRVRDLHAEVLCRRALRRFLSEQILADLQQKEQCNFLQRTTSATTSTQGDCYKWQLRANCSWHAYFSSTPCGNATLKKFATLRKETFRQDLDFWPLEPHGAQPGHSVHLGQFALLVKKDASLAMITDMDNDAHVTPPRTVTNNLPPPPANNIPAGTAAVHTRQGSLHTCSDKVCRWNCLGWQGSLLASLLSEPLHVQSLSVGRKFSAVCLKRAICCRIASDDNGENKNCTTSRKERKRPLPRFAVHHPSVMCTAVYVDADTTVIPQNAKATQDLQFTDTRAFVWWPGLTRAHLLDGTTGLAAIVDNDEQNDQGAESPICTKQLTEFFLEIQKEIGNAHGDKIVQTLTDLRRFKLQVSPTYETTKDRLLTSHKVMKDWMRRAAPTDNIEQEG